jgi:hypothetical protein
MKQENQTNTNINMQKVIKPKQFKKLAVMIAKEDRQGWHRFINKVLAR